MTLIEDDLIENLAESKSISIPTAEAIVHELFGSMADSLIAGNRIKVRNFGCFEIREYKGYSGRNP